MQEELKQKAFQILEENRKITYDLIYPYLNLEFANLNGTVPKSYFDAIKEYPMRQGKGLRPTLLLLSYEAFGGKKELALNTAAAFQLFEDWVLIHDDIEDWSDERRNKPALHKLIGMELALNAGDSLHVIMWKVLMDNEKLLGKKNTIRIMNEMANVLLTTTIGQHKEIEWIQKQNFDITEKDFFEMAEMKAGVYTVAGPITLGAAVAGAKKSLLKKIHSHCRKLGVAFQLQDDILNLTADAKKYGKEIGGDIWEGKRTLILIHTLKNCSPEERQRVIEVYKKKREEKNEEEVKFVWELMKKHQSVEYAINIARKLGQEAKQELVKLIPTDNKAGGEISILFDFIVNREL